MVHVNVTKPHHFIFFDFHPIEAMTGQTRRETSIASEFSEVDSLADFYVQDCCSQPSGNPIVISVIAASRARTRSARARGTMVDVLFTGFAVRR